LFRPISHIFPKHSMHIGPTAVFVASPAMKCAGVREKVG